MTLRDLVSPALRLLVVVVLAVSGLYLLLYLYRWEWNRAIVSGLFFVASEVALATAMLSQRLRALEQRTAPPPDASAFGLERLRATPVDRPDPFAWLKPQSGRMGVFVPVLLGAGAILSTIAFLVERIAEATAVPVLDRRLAGKLSGLAPPPGGLRGRHSASLPPAAGPAQGTLVRTALGVVAIVVLAWLGIDALADATESRPDPADRPAVTTIELAITERGREATPVQTAEALWVSCRATLGSQSRSVTSELVALDGDHVQLALTPGIGELRTRRLTGCLSDLQMNQVMAEVVDVESSP